LCDIRFARLKLFRHNNGMYKKRILSYAKMVHVKFHDKHVFVRLIIVMKHSCQLCYIFVVYKKTCEANVLEKSVCINVGLGKIDVKV